ncbi:hypothetical protein BDW60DRAFT_225588 [Aspergillus nidulans var. acristatus]
MTSKGNNDTSGQHGQKSYYKTVKEGGFENFQHFMQSHNLKMYNDDDIQLGKEILRRYEEHNRTCADDTSHTNHASFENDKPTEANAEAYDSDSDSDPPSGVHLGYYETREDDEDDAASGEEGCRLDAVYSHSEWGVDEPEFECYPAFSDDEEAFGQDGWSNEADYGEDTADGYDGYDGYDGHDCDDW